VRSHCIQKFFTHRPVSTFDRVGPFQLTGELVLYQDRAERGDARRELRRLAKETRARQRLAVDEVVASANVVCCTLAGALGGVLKDQARSVPSLLSKRFLFHPRTRRFGFNT
jgi:hypothetical protein